MLTPGGARQAHAGAVVAVCWLARRLGVQFEVSGGFQRFIADTFHLESATEKEKERALERLKKLYEQVLADYVEHLLGNQSMPQIMPQTMAQGMPQGIPQSLPQLPPPPPQQLE